MKALFFILLTCTSCVSGYVKGVVTSDTEREVYVKVVTARWPEGDQSPKVQCSKQIITYKLGYGEFTLNTPSESVHLRETYKIHSAPDLYAGVSDSGMYNTLYAYMYRDRLYIQITPIPKGFMDKPIQCEKFYIVSTENICEQPNAEGTIVQSIDKN
jgi:hypothetical protein